MKCEGCEKCGAEENKMNNYFCEICKNHWFGNAKCPNCGETIEIRKTLSSEEAEREGIK